MGITLLVVFNMFLTPSIVGDALLLAIVGLIISHAIRLYLKKRWILLDPLNMFWSGIFICYIIQPISAGDVFISWHSISIFDKTLLAVLFGLFFVVVGYESNVPFKIIGKIPHLPPRLNSTKLSAASWVLMAVGIAGYSYVIILSGGFSNWISVGRGGTDYEKVQGYMPQLMELLPAGVALQLFRANLHRNQILRTEKILAWVAAALTWVWFLYLGSRSRLIMFSVIMLAAYFLPRRRNPNFWLVTGLFVALEVLVSFQAIYRGYFTNLSFNFDAMDKKEMVHSVLPEFLGGDRNLRRGQISSGIEFNCAMAVVELVPEQVPYNYGYGFLQIFTGPIPKAFWPNKPYPHLESVQGVLREGGLSGSINEGVRHEDLLMGPAFGFVGHWYYVGGFVGLAIGGLITGCLLRTIRLLYDLFQFNESNLIIFPLLLPIGFLEAAATPWFWVYTMPFSILPLVFVLYMCRERGVAFQKTGLGVRTKRLQDRDLAAKGSNVPV